MTCRQAARLISDALDAEPPLSARVQLAVHTLLCAACRRYRHQLTAIDEAVGQLLERAEWAGGGLPDAAKERLKAALREGLGDESE